MDWNELVLHPVRLRVLQHLLSRIKEAIGEVLGSAAGEDRRLRTLAIVSAPPEGNAEDEEGGR